MSYSLPVVGVVLMASATTTDARTLLSSAREAAQRVQAYCTTGTYHETPFQSGSPESVPTRPRPVDRATMDRSCDTAFVEDRFDRDVGRSLMRMRGPLQSVRPYSALTIRSEASTDLLTRFRIRNSCEDLLWVLQPVFGGFDLLDLVASHPDLRVIGRGDVQIVEVPVAALAEFEEFGARLLIDTRRGHALAGADVYLNSGGAEQLVLRYDVTWERRESAGPWMPVEVRQWERKLPDRGDNDRIQFRLSELVLDREQSVVGRLPAGREVLSAEWQADESRRMALTGGLEQVLYKPANPRERLVPVAGMQPRLWLVAFNVILLIGIATYIRTHRARSRDR